ncbi:hypothetical protein BASA82_000622 [Batrachochytrium salamandrivorans]|nr:hypothetical protein BASA62_009500 [Batrachochytrium salamandrivorans]KAH9262317.1 hypothetical protein BASA82_000622 [Batrachochytrium salamandrivorans]
MEQQPPQNDPALEAFDRVREVLGQRSDTVSAFLPKFQSIAASLRPDERIKLEVVYAHESSMELLRAALADPQANKVCSLVWRYDGKEDVNSILPLLVNDCPELASLQVEFSSHSAFDFVSSVLEYPGTKVKELAMLNYPSGDLARFFAALGRSQVSALTLSCFPKFGQGLQEYLAKDLLVRLKVWMNRKRVPPEMMMSLAKCARLAELKLAGCNSSLATIFIHLPKSITTLTLDDCTFFRGMDWSFLSDSNVRELDLRDVRAVDGTQLGSALAVHLRAKGLAKLRLFDCQFVNEALAGVELGRIQRLMISRHFSDASFAQIALALQSPNSEMRELVLEYNRPAGGSVKTLVSALKHPNCNLAKLSLCTNSPRHEAVAKRIESKFRHRLVLFALLQGRQARRLYCPLRRLPVEMFRLVGMVLI